MRELVAVNNFFFAFSMRALKQEALMFDRIVIPKLGHFVSFFQNLLGEYPPELIDYEWLFEQGLLIEKEHKKGAKIENEEYQNITTTAKSYKAEIEKLYKEHGVLQLFTELDEANLAESAEKLKQSLVSRVSDVEKLATSQEFINSITVAFDINARGLAIELRELEGLDAYPILIYPPPTTINQVSSSSNVIDITFNALPVPDDNTPWEQIIEFRLDPESKKKFTALKDWTNEVARMQLKPYEVSERLECLLNDYKDHMRTHRIKTTLDTLKTIAITEAGFITSGWFAGLSALFGVVGMVASPLFSIKQRKVALLEAERQAPGRQVAYIVKAKEAFEG